MNFCLRFFVLAVFFIFEHASYAQCPCNRAHEPVPPATVVLPSRKMCELKDTRLNEISGLAASRRYAAQNLIWTHNDSGGEAKVFAINLQGDTIAEVLLTNAKNVDWEDMAASGEFLYVADIGDNLKKRESITIYRLREPPFDATATGQVLQSACETMTLKYPDGAHDAETLLVTPQHEIFLVTKSPDASRVFKTPQPFQDGGAQTLELIGAHAFTGPTLFSQLATGGSLAPDGTRLVLRTYTHAYEWTIPEKVDWKNLWHKPPRVWELPASHQGEAICYSADGEKYFTSSEGERAPIFEIAN